MGQDVPIYAPTNTGRGYKLGYIAGINGCGLVFFGLTFWQPKRIGKGKGVCYYGEREILYTEA
jgi:hypothetical protein